MSAYTIPFYTGPMHGQSLTGSGEPPRTWHVPEAVTTALNLTEEQRVEDVNAPGYSVVTYYLHRDADGLFYNLYTPADQARVDPGYEPV